MSHNLEYRFLDSIRESYTKYTEHGARSTEKLRPLHQWIADEMLRALGEGWVAQSLRKEKQGGEDKIAGKYYDKNVDISISKEGGTPLAIISVKFIASNFKQNANNYFEHLMGETANLRRAGVGFGYFMVLPAVVPYFKRDGTVAHSKVVANKDLQKYVNLGQDDDYPHKPEVMGIVIISLPTNLQNADEITLTNLQDMHVSEEIKNALREFSLPNFIHHMKALVEAKG